jgi:hypothetical protein
MKCNKKFTVIVIAVAASLLLGGTILAPVRPAFAQESDTNTQASRGEGETPTTVNINLNVENSDNSLVCPAFLINRQAGTQQGINFLTQAASNSIGNLCSTPTSVP